MPVYLHMVDFPRARLSSTFSAELANYLHIAHMLNFKHSVAMLMQTVILAAKEAGQIPATITSRKWTRNSTIEDYLL